MGLGPDNSYSGQSVIYRKQQPDGATFNGATVTTEQVFDAGSLVQHYGQESYGGTAQAAKAAFTIAQDASAGCDITIQLADGGGNAISGQPVDVDVYLSDAASGVGLTATTPDTSLTVGNPGTQLVSYVTKKAVRATCATSGQIKLVIVDTAKTGYYIAVVGLPVAFVSRQLVTGDYK